MITVFRAIILFLWICWFLLFVWFRALSFLCFVFFEGICDDDDDDNDDDYCMSNWQTIAVSCV